MSLDGLRAWIGVVERKLTMRTRVFLVLVAIAVGGAGAAIYLAIEAENDSVSKSDLQQVRGELAGTTATPGSGTAQLEAEVAALQEEVAALRAEGSNGGAPAAKGDGGEKPSSEESTGGVPPGGTKGATEAPKTQKQLEELVKKAEQEAKKK
jgi:hypothetical protein